MSTLGVVVLVSRFVGGRERWKRDPSPFLSSPFLSFPPCWTRELSEKPPPPPPAAAAAAAAAKGFCSPF